jgi:pyruvate/2-oxoglutarate dehydrogenase complex dihydrolipoamide dehydrogenase (E3) component
MQGKIQVVIANRVGQETIEGSHLLFRHRRRPNIGGLALDAAGIKHRHTGITNNKRPRTRNRRVCAIDDLIGRVLFTHAANYRAGLVVLSALFRLPAKINYNLMCWVTYTDPSLRRPGRPRRGRGR